MLRQCARATLVGKKSPITLGKRAVWLARYRLRAAKSGGKSWHGFLQEKQGQFGLERCEIRYINLSSRSDRRRSLTREFHRLDLKFFLRFGAIEHKRGSVGCAKSHAEVVSTPAAAGKLLMVCEDDLEFLASRADLDLVVEDFAHNENLDVLCLAFNSIGVPYKISDYLSITNNTQTTACYVVKESGRQLLGQEFEKSVVKILRGDSDKKSAIDQQWKKLQNGRLFFAVPNLKMAKQAASFSDIEGRFVDYDL